MNAGTDVASESGDAPLSDGISERSWEQRQRLEQSELEEFERLERAASQPPGDGYEDGGRRNGDWRREGKGQPRAGQRQARAGDSVEALPSAVQAKIHELEDEIARFREENARAAAARAAAEDALAALRREREAFESHREGEMARLKKERRVLDMHSRAARASAGPDRDFQAELGQLRKEVAALHDQMRQREEKHSLTVARHRNRVQELTQKCAALEGDVSRLRTEREGLVAMVEQLTKAARSTADRAEVARARAAIAAETGPADVAEDSGIPAPTARHQRASSSASAAVADSQAGHEERDASARLRPEASRSGRASPSAPKGQDGKLRPEGSARGRSPSPVGTRAPSKSAAGSGGRAVSRSRSSPAPEVNVRAASPAEANVAVTTFPNGTRKETMSDGSSTVHFFNGDVKRTHADGRVVYYYAESNTTHTTHPDGLEVYRFGNGQVERHHPDGSKEVVFPDATVKRILADGSEVSTFPDGTVQRLSAEGERTIEFEDGRREVHGRDYRRREYPDGTSKTIRADGRRETRYPSGRLRIKDASGAVIYDGMGQ